MKLVPCEDNLIVEIIEQEPRSGMIVIPDSALEESTLARVLVPNRFSYNRDGSPREPYLKKGDLVRIPKGKVGTEAPEAPEGKKWLAIPEDCIYYTIEEEDDEDESYRCC